MVACSRVLPITLNVSVGTKVRILELVIFFLQISVPQGTAPASSVPLQLQQQGRAGWSWELSLSPQVGGRDPSDSCCRPGCAFAGSWS